jgi:hypothetical protein
MSELIGVIGAYGGVGTGAARQLHAWGHRPLRLGGRSPQRAQRLAAVLGDGTHAVAVDAADPASLAEFCRGCRLVVNCAGPSLVIGDAVARATLAAGADYVAAGGDEPLHELLTVPGAVPRDRTALLSAGMLPGLSALLPRALATELEQPTCLTLYAGGLGRFTPGAASDYVASAASGYGIPCAAWRGGAIAHNALVPLSDASLPFFPGSVTAFPYVSRELERVATQIGLRDASSYTVFVGDHVLRAIERPSHEDADALAAAAAALGDAAELDLFGRDPFQLFVVRLDDAGGHARSRTLVLHASDPIGLTGAAVAVAADAVVCGTAPAGLGFAGEALAPRPALQRLRRCAAVPLVEVIPSPPAAAAVGMHEGVL